MKRAKIILTVLVISSFVAGAFATAVVNGRVPPPVWFTHNGQTLQWLAFPCSTGQWQCFVSVGNYGLKAIYRTTDAAGHVTQPYSGPILP